MAIRIENYPPFRECRFCLSLQEGAVFADFDVDAEGRAFLRRISFDGYGCCGGEFQKLSLDDSRLLLGAIDHDTLRDPKVEEVLQSYLRANTDLIWSDALATHELA
jgi:hypothetical protein